MIVGNNVILRNNPYKSKCLTRCDHIKRQHSKDFHQVMNTLQIYSAIKNEWCTYVMQQRKYFCAILNQTEQRVTDQSAEGEQYHVTYCRSQHMVTWSCIENNKKLATERNNWMSDLYYCENSDKHIIALRVCVCVRVCVRVSVRLSVCLWVPVFRYVRQGGLSTTCLASELRGVHSRRYYQTIRSGGPIVVAVLYIGMYAADS